MLRPSGPAKNSGKMVTTLMRSGAARPPASVAWGSVIEQPGRWLDANPASLSIHAGQDAVVGDHHRAPSVACDVEREPLRQFIRLSDRSNERARRQLDAHADEIVDIDFVLRQLRQFVRGSE